MARQVTVRRVAIITAAHIALKTISMPTTPPPKPMPAQLIAPQPAKLLALAIASQQVQLAAHKQAALGMQPKGFVRPT